MRSFSPASAALFALTGSVSLLWTQEAFACANAMKEGGVDPNAQMVMMVLGGSLLAVMFFMGLYLRSQHKERAERYERYKDLDSE